MEARTKRDSEEKTAANFDSMEDAAKTLFDTMVLEWKKAKAQACVDDSESLDCTRADNIRAYQENLRN